MRKVLLSLAVLAMISAPAMASYVVAGGIQQVPKGVNSSGPHRPEVDGSWIAATQNMGTGNWGGELYNTMGGAMVSGIGAAQYQCILGGYDWSTAEDLGGNWAVFGGAPTMQSQNYPIVVYNRYTGATFNVAVGNVDEHLTRVNKFGDMLWQDWGNGPADSSPGIMWTQLSGTGYSTPVQVVNQVAGDAGTSRVNLANDARRFSYRTGGSGDALWVYDLASSTNTRVFNVATDLDGTGRSMKAFFPGLDDTGNWMSVNMRPVSIVAGEVGQSSDIWLFNVSNPAAPSHIALFGNYAAVRNDPRMEVIDADTAIIVWDEDASNTNTTFDIKAAVIKGLSSTPVLDQVLTVASGSDNQRYADLDVRPDGAVLVSWINKTTGSLEYTTIIPEPASLALLGLGVLALARRR